MQRLMQELHLQVDRREKTSSDWDWCIEDSRGWKENVNFLLFTEVERISTSLQARKVFASDDCITRKTDCEAFQSTINHNYIHFIPFPNVYALRSNRLWRDSRFFNFTVRYWWSKSGFRKHFVDVLRSWGSLTAIWVAITFVEMLPQYLDSDRLDRIRLAHMNFELRSIIIIRANKAAIMGTHDWLEIIN